MRLANEGKQLLGCTLRDGSAHFEVWAPRCERVEVHLMAPDERFVEMQAVGDGYFRAVVDGVEPGATYYYRLDGQTDRPDPASRLQPEGVHGPSAVVERSGRAESSSFRGIPLRDYIIYELHVGTFTAEGTFAAAIERLDSLCELGVTAVEIMPVAAFPGRRNWGYDGVHPFAVQASYGGPEGLEAFVEACHKRGLAVVLDVVYNHLGPEGNYLHDYGPYFTDKYHTPWGSAVNFDDHGSDHVRRYFLQNAAQWIEEFDVDALRLDAVHAIYDDTAQTFLEELRLLVQELRDRHNRHIHLFAETNANDPSLVRRPEEGGVGMDAQWADDFHHAMHTLLTDERQGYYCDYGTIPDLAAALRDAYTYTGQHSEYRGRRHGAPPGDLPAERFVVCIQNHDQIGNRQEGRRLGELVDFEQQKLAATALLCSPYIPLLFMGEEYGETAPFPYFVDHGDAELVEAVRQGRAEQFSSFEWPGEPPDPAAESTFASATLDHQLREREPHATLLALYRRLIELRGDLPALSHLRRDRLEVTPLRGCNAIAFRRWHGRSQALILLNFGADEAELEIWLEPSTWHKRLETSAETWGGRGARLSDEIASRRDEPTTFDLRGHSAAVLESSFAVGD